MEPSAPPPGVAQAGDEAWLTVSPTPDMEAEPSGFVVLDDGGPRIHFLDWGGPDPAEPTAPRAIGPAGTLLMHGIAQTAWAWTPVARRVRRRSRVIAMDLRGHGLSDAPVDGYDRAGLAGDTVAVAEGSGLLEAATTVVLAGHGFGAVVAAWAAEALGPRCAGLVLVDGGWERAEEATGLDIDEFLRTVEEPPEVLRSMRAFLADREAFDPATWDADQEAAARATVVETAAGRVVAAIRPHALAATVEAMYDYEPLQVLTDLEVPLIALVARDEDGRRRAALDRVVHTRREAGRGPTVVQSLGDLGHNLMRYRPAAVSGAILSLADRADLTDLDLDANRPDHDGSAPSGTISVEP